MKILVTGGTGFIGGWVVRELMGRGHTVRIFARNPHKVPGLFQDQRVEWASGELSDLDRLGPAVEGCDAVAHVALGWGETPESMLRNDTLPTTVLLQESASRGVKRFVYTSSTAAMGDLRSSMAVDLCNLPHDLYGATKSASESFVLGFAGRLRTENSAMLCNVVRPGYTFGNPAFEGGTTQPDRRFWNIVAAVAQDRDVRLVRNDGTQFIAGCDIAKVYASLLEGDLDRRVFLALGTEWISWEWIAREAILMSDSRSQILLEDRGWGDKPVLFDVSPLWDFLGYHFTAKEKIREHLQHCFENLNGRQATT